MRCLAALLVGAMLVGARTPIGATPTGAAPPASPGEAAAQVGRRLLVGPQRPLRSVAAAAAIAQDGDTVEIDPGDYLADVAVWTQDRLTIRGAGPGVRLIARGASAEDKAIWVVRGGRVTVDGIQFIGARVADRNGAGIRFERGQLLVQHCLFEDNETGILAANRDDAELEVRQSAFAFNGAGDGRSHHLYAGRIRRLSVVGSLFHHGRVGHLIKSRAAHNLIAYNRLADGSDGRASYELEFPNGGVARVLGNQVQQSSQTSNPVLVSYGAEGWHWPDNRLDLAYNTLVNDHAHRGTFVHVAPGAAQVRMLDNLLVGLGGLDLPADAERLRNHRLQRSDLALPADPALGAWPLDAALRARLLPRPATDIEPELLPRLEYRHPMQLQPLDGATRVPGALQSLSP
jgi:hypothetical protein